MLTLKATSRPLGSTGWVAGVWCWNRKGPIFQPPRHIAPSSSKTDGCQQQFNHQLPYLKKVEGSREGLPVQIWQGNYMRRWSFRCFEAWPSWVLNQNHHLELHSHTRSLANSFWTGRKPLKAAPCRVHYIKPCHDQKMDNCKQALCCNFSWIAKLGRCSLIHRGHLGLRG